jgi:hypothetical protein
MEMLKLYKQSTLNGHHSTGEGGPMAVYLLRIEVQEAEQVGKKSSLLL